MLFLKKKELKTVFSAIVWRILQKFFRFQIIELYIFYHMNSSND